MPVHRGKTWRAKTTCRASLKQLDTGIGVVALGRSDLMVSECCMGTMTFGEQNTEKEAHKMLSMCSEAGINFLDTSEMYPVAPSRETQGKTSEIIGTWMKARDRSSMVVASKVVGRSVMQPWVRAGRTSPRSEEGIPCLDKASIKAACEGELRRLQTDYIDLFYLHWPDRYVPAFGRHRYRLENEREAIPFEEQVEAIGELIREGKVRHWALSNETPYGVMSHVATADALAVARPVAMQQSFSLIHREAEGSLAELCSPSTLGMALLPWSALAGGVLSGKYLGGKRPKSSRMVKFEGRYARFMSERSLEAAELYAATAQRAGLTPSQLAYGFCASRWFIPSTIIGATSCEQLQENLASFSAPLSDEVLEEIDTIYLRHRDPSLED